jgi:hypothetical protein
LVDTAERRHIDCLATNSTSRTNTGAVLAGTTVDDGVDGNLDGVLVGHDVDLFNTIYQWMPLNIHPSTMSSVTYDLESVSDDADSHELFTVVAAIHHKRVGEALDDRALSLAESLDSISTSGVGDVDW